MTVINQGESVWVDWRIYPRLSRLQPLGSQIIRGPNVFTADSTFSAIKLLMSSTWLFLQLSVLHQIHKVIKRRIFNGHADKQCKNLGWY